MGNSGIRDQFAFDSTKWTKKEEKGTYQVVENKSTKQEARLYPILLKDLEYTGTAHTQPVKFDQFQIYKLRRDNRDNLIKTFAGNVSADGFLCGRQEIARILVEPLAKTLNDVRYLVPAEANIVLYNALLGFKKTVEIYGVPCTVTDEMIAMTFNGETRVWVNQNFGTNEIETSRTSTQVSHMIEDIVEVINKKAPGAFPELYHNLLTSSVTFEKALNHVEQNSGLSISNLRSNRINMQNKIEGKQSNSPAKVMQRVSQAPRISFNYPTMRVV